VDSVIEDKNSGYICKLSQGSDLSFQKKYDVTEKKKSAVKTNST
jgi:hypothetical protein